MSKTEKEHFDKRRESKLTQPQSDFDVPTFFHTILFAYQKKLKDILGSGESVFVHPVLDTINLIEREKGLNLIKGETLDEVFDNFAKELMKTGFVKEASFENLGNEKFMFHVKGCAFAETCHDLLKPKDVACTFALIAMAIFQSLTGKRVKTAESDFMLDGADTLIEALDASEA
jgi:hypothetical protein